MGYAAYYTAYGGTAPARAGASHATIAPYGPFMSGDGKQIILAVQNEREWGRFCDKVLGQPELKNDSRFITNPKRVENRSAVDGIVSAALQKLTAKQIISRLEDAQIAYARL